MNDEFTRIALKKDNLPFQTNSKTHPFHLNARPFVSSFGCQPLYKTCCLTSSPANEPRVQRSTFYRAGGKFSWVVQNDEKATETKGDY